MELYLKKESADEISVVCDGGPSHSFILADLPSEPIEIGAILFSELFRDGTPAHAAWMAHPKRILFVTEDVELDAIPWEHLYSPDGFIVLDIAFVRGLPERQRQPAPDLTRTPLHIIAIPSNPISHEISRLDIEGEWNRLKESLHGIDASVTLERPDCLTANDMGGWFIVSSFLVKKLDTPFRL
jgi:hypothetical protein